jgi:hypothetical protein
VLLGFGTGTHLAQGAPGPTPCCSHRWWMAMQLQNLGGASAIVVGAFCEHNDQVHSPLNLLAAKAGPGAETETGLGNKSAVAFEKQRIRLLRMAAGAWRDYRGSIHARLPFVHSEAREASPWAEEPKTGLDLQLRGV